jgi:hypothetical protein
VSCGAPKASEIPELAVIKDLHHRLRFAFLVYLVLLMIGVGVPCARLDHLAPDFARSFALLSGRLMSLD